MAGSVSSILQSQPHVHFDDEVCPWCEQSIPHDRFEEISARIAHEEQAKLAEHENRLRDQFAQERRQLAADARAEIETAKRLAEETMARFKEEADAKAASIAADAERMLAEAVARSRQETEAAFVDRVAAAEAAAIKALEDSLASETALRNMEETIATRTAEATEKHKLDLAAAIAGAEAAVEEKLRASIEASAAKVAAAEAAKVEAETAAQDRLAEIERERSSLQRQLVEAGDAHRAELVERTNEVRESMSREMSKALLDAQKLAFDEKQKLTASVDDLKRQLEKKTAAELGEGSEIDLFEALKQTFEGDSIRRVPKGENGADVVHEIIENGTVCGTIVSDRKNRNAWQNNFVSKLRSDMIAAKADHAILSTNKFPAGARQLHLMEGVVIACPARVVALVEMLRAHVVQSHALRMSAEQREEKTAALYDYIISDRCAQLMDSLQSSFEKLEDIDVDEKKAHDTVWAKRGKILKEVEKTRGTFVFELQRIIGTAQAAE